MFLISTLPAAGKLSLNPSPEDLPAAGREGLC